MATVAVILAGGRSSRMGRDKAVLELEGRSFLERLVRRYETAFDRVYVSSPRRGTYTLPGAEELPDLRPGRGPLAGLEAAFLSTAAETVFLTAVDLPFGDPALALHLTAELGEADACLIRRTDGEPEPLFAVYRRTCLPDLQACLEEGRGAMKALLDRLSCRMVEESALEGWDLDHILQNVNTPEDYRRARAAAER
ncbi:molybdenum cofactor guanylyltransferase [Pseudoflavonifractor phocaeensis]|uniref:molybdenum cofactor guanylyltransferase n=1 Tax=Pseudoflavonifractor phocaeensis TaxID=1870988 RepID=UPI00195CC57F|nr:molybdenum cofactor guanylyltransferase [Pseudoflavonifractor phocaeensis]